MPEIGIGPISRVFQTRAVTKLATPAYSLFQSFMVGGTGLEPARSCDHNPLKVARLPISPPAQITDILPYLGEECIITLTSVRSVINIKIFKRFSNVNLRSEFYVAGIVQW